MATDPGPAADGTAPWSVVTVRAPGRPEPRCAALAGGQVVDLPALRGYAGLAAALDDWARVEPELRAWGPDGAAPLPGAEVLAPLRRPGKVLCAGANYRDHLAEMAKLAESPPAGADTGGAGAVRAGAPPAPFFFLKPPTAVIGPGEAIVVPDAALRVDWEAELAVVIGRRGAGVSEARALDHVAGYTIANDVSARAPHRRPDAVAPPFAWDWLASKGRDTFLPLGPGVTPRWLVPDVGGLSVRLRVNGDLEQDGTTRDMVHGVAALVAAASRLSTLEPGDVILTGTPAGVGLPKRRFLAPGDHVEVAIDRLGSLANPVHPATTEAP